MLGTNWPRWVFPILRGVGVVIMFSVGGVPSSFVCVGGSVIVEGVDCSIWVSPICVGGCSVGVVSLLLLLICLSLWVSDVLFGLWVSPILVGGVSLSLVFVCGSVGVKDVNCSLWVSPIVIGGGVSWWGIIVIGVCRWLCSSQECWL